MALLRQPLPPGDTCADEPIRVPGSIQPHGWMAILHASDGRLIAHSSNWPGLNAFRSIMRGLRSGVSILRPQSSPILLEPTPAASDRWTCRAHRRGDLDILEFEAVLSRIPQAPEALLKVATDFAPALQNATSILELATLAAAQVKQLSGFGRCLVYRFDSEGHGEVLAEAKDFEYASYAGHWFPASDIPEQARELYVLNQFRLIVDAEAAPVPLNCLDAAWTHQGLDLSMAFLRGVSPVHLEYMRNMDVCASMSLSIVVGGRLWGMISCHCRTSRGLPWTTRDACAVLGRVLSMRVEAQERHDEAAQLFDSRKLALHVLSGLGRSDSTLKQLVLNPEDLLKMVNASGVAVVHEKECWTGGIVPAPEDVLSLARQISASHLHTFHANKLVDVYPMAASFSTLAAGVLAISVSPVGTHVVLWFRPEVIETLSWAGEPTKPEGASGAMSPRRSFATYTQEVRGKCRPWSPADLACVAEVRHALISLVLARVQERDALSSELVRTTRNIDFFMHSVSHELLQPIVTAGSFGQLARQRLVAAADVSGLGYIDRVLKAIVRISAISDSLLELARISRTTPRRMMTDVSALAKEVADSLQQRNPSRRVTVSIQPGMTTYTDDRLLEPILDKLLENAWEATSQRSVGNIDIGSDTLPNGAARWWVRDDGMGFDPELTGSKAMNPDRGSVGNERVGGLSVVHASVATLGGRVQVESEEGRGAIVYFTLGP